MFAAFLFMFDATGFTTTEKPISNKDQAGNHGDLEFISSHLIFNGTVSSTMLIFYLVDQSNFDHLQEVMFSA